MTGGAGDRRFLLGLVLGFCALAALPTVAAALQTPGGSRFTGLVAHPYDLTYYVASERGAATGSGRANRFTSEVDAPGPVAPLYKGLGAVERAAGLPPASLFHMPQVIAAPILVLVVWWIAGLVHPSDRSARRWSAALALFGAGAAAVTAGGFGGRSADGAVFELTPILSLGVFPHFAVAYVGLALVWGAILCAIAGHGVRPAAAAGALGGLLLGLSHGFLLLPALVGGAVLAPVLALAGRRRDGVAVAAGTGAALLCAAPFLLVLSREQARFERLQGHRFPSRPSDAWWTWVVGQPILVALLVVGAVVVVRSGGGRRPATWAVALWLSVQGALVFLPVTVFERRFSEGIVIPAALFAGAGAGWLLREQRAALRWALCALLVLPSVSLAWQAGGRSLSVDPAMDELARSLGASDVVLAGTDLSWKLPALSDATTYLGRTVETLHYREKRAAAQAYVADPTSPRAQRWLSGSGITAIALDARDETLPQPPAAAAACFVEVAYGPHLRVLRPVAGCAPQASYVPVSERQSAPA